MASVRFFQLVLEHLPAKASERPHFDGRIWQVPTLADAADVFVWCEDDATKNSITITLLFVALTFDLHRPDAAPP